MSFVSAQLFTKLLNLGDEWEAYDTQYVEEKNTEFSFGFGKLLSY